MNKEIFYSNQAREKLQKGVDKLANAVKTTLGPRGKVAVFERGSVIFSLDGVTVAKQIHLKDFAEQMGVKLLQDVASKTDKEAGDGTTTATILSQSIFNQGIKALASGIDHIQMKKGMDEAGEIIGKTIKKIAKPIKSAGEISNVATISSREREIGDLVAEMIGELGKEAVIAVEEDKIIGIHKEIIKGMKLEKGYLVPHFMTNLERAEAVLEDPYILVSSQVISSNQDIGRIMEQVYRTDKRTFLVIADNVKAEALATLIVNKLQGRLLSVAISAPGFGDDKLEQLQDIACFTGAKFVSEDTGIKVEDAKLEDLGRAKKIIITKDETIIIGGAGKKQEIDKRAGYIKSQLKNEKSDYQKELKEKRLAKLQGGIGIIKVGAHSEAETMEKRYRIEDAVKSAKSAIEEGIVPGAGMCLMECSREIDKRIIKEKDLSYRIGLEIIRDAIQEPARQIILNAGGKPDVILEKCKENYGFDSSKNEFCDLIERGIIDPAKVVRCAIENALSVASLFLITETLIVSEQEEKNEPKTS